MYSFKNDYSEGAHVQILQAMMQHNMTQSDGYGRDRFTKEASDLIKDKVGSDKVDIHFLTGGTQTNLTAISAFLRPHEAVISANTGHILVHETGAIEATGHKIISVEVSDGKLSPEHILKVLAEHADEHMVKPKLVFISNVAEVGTIYNKSEITNLSKVCKANDLFLYMDGARLGSALASKASDLTLNDLPLLLDAFYIGGTKNGALLGEALVIVHDHLKIDFRYHIKQKGALLAKGRMIAIAFIELFKNNLYFELAEHANLMAEELRIGIENAGYTFLTASYSNQIFPILPNLLIEKLKENFGFYVWSKHDDTHSSIRLVTSWATQEKYVKALLEEIKGA